MTALVRLPESHGTGDLDVTESPIAVGVSENGAPLFGRAAEATFASEVTVSAEVTVTAMCDARRGGGST